MAFPPAKSQRKIRQLKNPKAWITWAVQLALSKNLKILIKWITCFPSVTLFWINAIINIQWTTYLPWLLKSDHCFFLFLFFLKATCLPKGTLNKHIVNSDILILLKIISLILTHLLFLISILLHLSYSRRWLIFWQRLRLEIPFQ